MKPGTRLPLEILTKHLPLLDERSRLRFNSRTDALLLAQRGDVRILPLLTNTYAQSVGARNGYYRLERSDLQRSPEQAMHDTARYTDGHLARWVLALLEGRNVAPFRVLKGGVYCAQCFLGARQHMARFGDGDRLSWIACRQCHDDLNLIQANGMVGVLGSNVQVPAGYIAVPLWNAHAQAVQHTASPLKALYVGRDTTGQLEWALVAAVTARANTARGVPPIFVQAPLTLSPNGERVLRSYLTPT